MRFGTRVRWTVTLLAALAPLVSSNGNPNTSEDECSRIAHAQIYSNALYVKEAGDVIGYELALQQPQGNPIHARLYIYQGAPNEDGISLSGQFSGKKLTIEGSWVQHLIEYPSKKEIIETQVVRVDGTLDSRQFRGTIKVEGLANPIKVRLKRVDNIWLCNRQTIP
jgi:hypothetical protein